MLNGSGDQDLAVVLSHHVFYGTGRRLVAHYDGWAKSLRDVGLWAYTVVTQNHRAEDLLWHLDEEAEMADVE